MREVRLNIKVSADTDFWRTIIMYKRVLAIMLMLSCALYTACGSKGGDISSSIDRVNEVNQTNSKEEEVNDKETNY